MKKLFLILSLLGIVGVQASCDESKLYWQKIPLREEVEKQLKMQLEQEREEKKIVLEDDTTVEHSLWQLKSNYRLLLAQIGMASEALYQEQDRNYLKAIVERVANGDFGELIRKAYFVKNALKKTGAKHPLTDRVYDFGELLNRKIYADKNYEFIVECAPKGAVQKALPVASKKS